MRLSWTLHKTPIEDSSMSMLFDFSHVELSEASFETIAQGGYGGASLAIANPSEKLIQMAMDQWMCRRILATDGGGRVAYEGYVAELSGVLNHHRFSRSIDSFANRAFVDYTYSGGTCPKGSTCKGRVQLNESNVGTVSTQSIYGIKEIWSDMSSIGKSTSALATAYATVTLKDALRARSFEFELGKGSDPRENQLQITIWGYYTTLQWRKTNIQVRTSMDSSAIVKRALTIGTKAPHLNTDQSQITNTGKSLTFNKEGKLYTLQDFIQTAIIDGDSNAKVLFFQVWEERIPYLFSRPSSPRYFSRYDDTRIWDGNRMLVQPYMVRAGSFIVSENVTEALDQLTDVLQRERTSFLDRTHYDDINETLSLPVPQELMSTERILARARRKMGQFN